MVKLSAALMQLGAALFIAPLVAVLLLHTGALLPLMPWGAGLALLGLLLALLDTR